MDTELTSWDIECIQRAVDFGRRLQIEHPEINVRSKRGDSLAQIAEEFRIDPRYNSFTQKEKVEGVKYALFGSAGNFGTARYDGLILLDSKNEMLEKKIHKHYQDRNGTFRNERRITTEQRKKFGSMGGKKSYRTSVGIFALTPEEMRQSSLRAIQAQGKILWSLEQIEEVYALSLSPDYRYGSMTNNEKIAETMNMKYHGGENVRTASAIHNILKKYRSSLKEKVN